MLNRSASLAMSTSVLKALPGKLDIKRHSPSILYVSYVFLPACLEGKHVKLTGLKLLLLVFVSRFSYLYEAFIHTLALLFEKYQDINK